MFFFQFVTVTAFKKQKEELVLLRLYARWYGLIWYHTITLKCVGHVIRSAEVDPYCLFYSHRCSLAQKSLDLRKVANYPALSISFLYYEIEHHTQRTAVPSMTLKHGIKLITPGATKYQGDILFYWGKKVWVSNETQTQSSSWLLCSIVNNAIVQSQPSLYEYKNTSFFSHKISITIKAFKTLDQCAGLHGLQS